MKTGAKPRKIVTAKLYATDSPVDSTLVGNSSENAARIGPVYAAISKPNTPWNTISDARPGVWLMYANIGHASSRIDTAAPERNTRRPKRSASLPTTGEKHMIISPP